MKTKQWTAKASIWTAVVLMGACGGRSADDDTSSQSSAVAQQRSYIRAYCEFKGRCGAVTADAADLRPLDPCNINITPVDVAECVDLEQSITHPCQVDKSLYDACSADLKTLRCVTQEELDAYCAQRANPGPRAESPDTAIWPESCKKLDERLRSPECGGPGEPDSGTGPTTVDGGK